MSKAGANHRMTMNLTPAAYTQLQALAKKRATTMGDVLRDAISLEVYSERVKDAGGRILVQMGGRVQELVRVRGGES